ncbi:MAG: hypothetical protein ACLTZI_08145 [[Eubacterium] siraeum]
MCQITSYRQSKLKQSVKLRRLITTSTGRYAEVFENDKNGSDNKFSSLMFWGQRGFGKTSVKVEQD